MASSPEGTWGLEDLEEYNKNLHGRRIDHPVKQKNTPEGLEDEELPIPGSSFGGVEWMMFGVPKNTINLGFKEHPNWKMLVS